MAARVRYQRTRVVIAAAVAASVVAGTAYFLDTPTAQGSTTGQSGSEVAQQAVSESSTTATRRSPLPAAPSKRTRGS